MIVCFLLECIIEISFSWVLLSIDGKWQIATCRSNTNISSLFLIATAKIRFEILLHQYNACLNQCCKAGSIFHTQNTQIFDLNCSMWVGTMKFEPNSIEIMAHTDMTSRRRGVTLIKQLSTVTQCGAFILSAQMSHFNYIHLHTRIHAAYTPISNVVFFSYSPFLFSIEQLFQPHLIGSRKTNKMRINDNSLWLVFVLSFSIFAIPRAFLHFLRHINRNCEISLQTFSMNLQIICTSVDSFWRCCVYFSS